MISNVNLMKIGVIAVQGAVSEHIKILEKSLKKLEVKSTAIPVRKAVEIGEVRGLIIPGGESTTISKLLLKFNLFENILKRAKEGMPIMGTCAGCILLAKETEEKIEELKLLKLMDMKVERNAFGRQKESFECDIEVMGLDSLYHAVFIRAPVIKKVWSNCKVLAKIEEKIVLAKQENFLGCAFHPELTSDTRIHELFLEMI